MLDRDRYYALVYGDDNAKFYQDGKFFTGAGRPIGEKPKKVEKEDAPTVVEQKPIHESSEVANDLVARLKAMHISKIKKIAGNLSNEVDEALPAPGSGAKARLIEYIIRNTE